jgi:hypothetical protein
MGDRFDKLSREMAAPLPRRGALKLLGGTFAASAAAVVLRPLRAEAFIPVCPVPCGDNCCDGPNRLCLNPSTGTCGCTAGSQACGPLCCPKGGSCTSDGEGTVCCCPKGATPCGSACCAKGVACLSRTSGICGCQPGTTPCGSAGSLTCCPAGAACSTGCPGPSNNEVSATCVGVPSDLNIKTDIVPVVWS